ncbi:MAG: hypothetical protein IJP86_05515 [Synergistaceae bacterium]|nr:hypothetical protein [Synergistaceae bacterium]
MKEGSAALEELMRERAEHERLKKERTRLKLMRERGELVELSAVRKSAGNVIANVKKKLLAFEAVLPPVLEGKDKAAMKEEIHRAVFEALEELSGLFMED